MKNNNLKVRLSEIKDEHVEKLMPLSNDPELISSMGWTPFKPNEKNRFLDFCRVLTVPGLKETESLIFAIIETLSNRPIGYVSIKGVDRFKKFAELGIAIMDKEYRRKGYGSQVLKQAVEYAFNELGLSRLKLTVFPFNNTAIRVYEKIGFHNTTLLKNSWQLADGQRCDMLLMELPRGPI